MEKKRYKRMNELKKEEKVSGEKRVSVKSEKVSEKVSRRGE